MNIRNAYSSWSSTYDSDRNLTRDLDQDVTRQILSASHYQTILEIGCGTGKNTPLLSQLGDRVTSLDFSEGMIMRAKTKVQSGNVQFAVADLTQPWPCAAQRVHLITCNLVLEHIQDLDFIFAEAQRVLVHAGQFFVCELHPFRQYQGKQATFQHGQTQTDIPAYVHPVSDFSDAATRAGLTQTSLREWWHAADAGKLPRLVSFLFEKSG